MATGFDHALAEASIAARTPGLERLAEAATLLGEAPVVGVLAAVLVAYAWARKRRREAVAVAVSLASGALVEIALKLVISRERPSAIDALIELPHSYSFPSGHSFAVMLLGLLAVWVVWRASERRWVRWCALAVAVSAACATGWSRVYLGVHWPSDVAAGWALAGAWFAATVSAERRAGRSAP